MQTRHQIVEVGDFIWDKTQSQPKVHFSGQLILTAKDIELTYTNIRIHNHTQFKLSYNSSALGKQSTSHCSNVACFHAHKYALLTFFLAFHHIGHLCGEITFNFSENLDSLSNAFRKQLTSCCSMLACL